MNPFKRFLQRLTSSQTKSSDNDNDGSRGWSIADQRATNNINEIRILSGHSDIVRGLVQLDERRCASASDDGSVVIWDTTTGRKLHTLKEHSLCVTCMLQIAPGVLATGSADRTVRIWDLDSGTCKSVIKDYHQGSVKCLAKINHKDWFCSGGNDRHIFVWNNNGELQGKIERQEEENMNCLLVLDDGHIITGSNSSILYVYSLDSYSYVKCLAYHRESVRTLASLSADRFASGSLDGSILVWHAGQEILPVFRLNFPEQYINQDHIYMYSVNCLLKVGESYLAACIGNGFKVYDTRTGDCVMDCQNAHNANVLSITSLYFDTVLVTSSADTSIRLWSARQGLNLSAPVGGATNTPPHMHATGVSSPQKSSKDQSRTSGSTGNKMQLSRSSPDVPKEGSGYSSRPGTANNQRRFVYQPMLIGELWGHCDQVNMLVPLSPFSFASASHDSTVMIWNDGRIEADKRSEIAYASLAQFKAQCEWNDQLLAATAAAASAAVGDDFDDDIAEENRGGETFNSPYRPRGRSRAHTVGVTGLRSQEDEGSEQRAVPPETGFKVFGARPTEPPSSPGVSSGGEESMSPLTSPESHSGGPSRNRSVENLHNLLISSPSQSGSTLRLGMSPAGRVPVQVRVPDYIFDNAVFMLREQDMSIEQIREELRQGGNSDTIVDATIQKLLNL
eukprot:TRINITY_DN6435_c0_g1_i1.p1 TRINITY_DN6435_c0_g1~~TRINITY_DN6435_c0_g1_i1.p1  ORF type:complete len:677 (+),score=70.25 TRINITY_DN6435_c0_g1_i1:296-2326(+)